MPLLDHFHPPLSKHRHWENLHSGWANVLRDQLNEGLLPPRYFAEVQITLGNRAEIDVATFDEGNGKSTQEHGGVAVWAPPRPPRSILLPSAPADIFEVQIYNDEEGPRLVGAIELVSPANKDRPANRHFFALKCASYLYQGVNLVLADVVTVRRGNLHAELFRLLKLTKGKRKVKGPDLYAGAYRVVPGVEPRLDYWLEPLAIGDTLPTLPLWLGPELVVPIELERAYQKVCASSRIGRRFQ